MLSQNLNCITLIATDDISINTTVAGGILTKNTFGFILEVIDYYSDEKLKTNEFEILLIILIFQGIEEIHNLYITSTNKSGSFTTHN